VSRLRNARIVWTDAEQETNRPPASSVATRTRCWTENWAGEVWGEGRAESSVPRFRFASSAPAPGVCPPHTRGRLSPSTTDDGLQVSDKTVYTRLILTCDSSSTNARFIESLDSKYKPSVDRVSESRRDDSDDEDEDTLFAELEAELENADSAALRGGGIKDMRAQFRRFSSVRP
jgi:hypothetical protein